MNSRGRVGGETGGVVSKQGRGGANQMGKDVGCYTIFPGWVFCLSSINSLYEL